MALVRAIPLKDFRGGSGNPSLSTGANGTAYNISSQVAAAIRAYAALHLMAVSTGRTLGFTLQSASSSGFATKTTEFSFTLTSELGATWPASVVASTDRVWWRAAWVLSTAASTAGTWSGLSWVGFK